MAWSAPPAFTVAQIVTAAQQNILSDDLKYLKGQAGAVAIEDALGVTVNTNAAGGATLTQSNAGGSAFASLYLVNDNASIGGLIRNSSGNTSYGGANALNMLTFSAHPLALGTNNIVRQTIASDGSIKFIGAGGGWLFLSANAVNNTLQTIAPAGTVTVGMLVWLCDRNNGAGAFATGFNGQVFSLTSALTYVNTDTLTLTLTAGGAITIQRTTGTNGTHQVNMMCMYF